MRRMCENAYVDVHTSCSISSANHYMRSLAIIVILNELIPREHDMCCEYMS